MSTTHEPNIYHSGNVQMLTSAILIEEVMVDHPDVRRFFADLPEDEHVSAVVRAVEVGVFCLERAQTGQQTDIVRREIETLLNEVEKISFAIPGEVQKELLLKIGTDDGQVLASVRKLIEQVAESLQKSTREVRQMLSEDLDPDKATSTLGKSLSEVRKLLDPDRNDSVPGRLNNSLTQLTAENGTLAKNVRTVVAEAIKPLADEVNRLSKDIKATEAAVEAVQQTIEKGVAYEDEVVEVLRAWGQMCGATVYHVGGDKKSGDIVIDILAASPLGIEMTIVVETKDHGNPSGHKVIRDEMTKAMDERKAIAGIYVSRRPEGLAKEIGEWSEGECTHGSYIATTHMHVMSAVRFIVMMAKFHAAQASNPDVDLGTVDAHVNRIRTALRCIKTINGKVGTIRNEAAGIQSEAELLTNEIKDALNSIEDCIRVVAETEGESVALAAD